MVSIDKYAVSIAVPLQESEIAELLGIEYSDDQLEVAYGAIDWDGIEDRLGELARSLVAEHGGRVRHLVAGDEAPEDDEGDDEDGAATDEADGKARGETPVWCRFGIVGDHTRSIDAEDIRPALDEIALDDLPEWGDEFSDGACDHGNELHRIAKRLGIIKTGALALYFDGIDERAYEDYYDARGKAEGSLHVER